MKVGAVPIDVQHQKGGMVLPFEDVLDWTKFSISAGPVAGWVNGSMIQ